MVSLVPLVSTVDAEDSIGSGFGDSDRRGVVVCVLGEAGCSSKWSSASLVEADVETESVTALKDGVGIGSSIGSICCVVLMDCTIFSRSIGVMCFSRPLLVLLVESVRRNSGRAFGMTVAGVGDVSSSSSSSETADSRLEDSSGTGMLVVAAFVAAFGFAANEHRGDSVDLACTSGEQQNVSRFHRRQLKFSSRLPPSIACDVLEKRDHMPNRSSTEPVSIVDMFSTRKSECSGRKGMSACWCAPKRRRANVKDQIGDGVFSGCRTSHVHLYKPFVGVPADRSHEESPDAADCRDDR